MTDPKQLTTIGRAEPVLLLDYLKLPVVAKVDSGADISSIWATNIVETDGQLSFVLFGPKQPGYSGQVITLSAGAYSKTRIANSFGQREVRYTTKLRIRLSGRTIVATFSLADRSDKLYPILLGRRLLKGKFVVDVARGEPLHTEEKARKQKLQHELNNLDDSVEA